VKPGRYRHKACSSVAGSKAFASAWLNVISRSSSAERIRAWAASAAAASASAFPCCRLRAYMEDEDAGENRQRREQVDVPPGGVRQGTGQCARQGWGL